MSGGTCRVPLQTAVLAGAAFSAGNANYNANSKITATARKRPRAAGAGKLHRKLKFLGVPFQTNENYVSFKIPYKVFGKLSVLLGSANTPNKLFSSKRFKNGLNSELSSQFLPSADPPSFRPPARPLRNLQLDLLQTCAAFSFSLKSRIDSKKLFSRSYGLRSAPRNRLRLLVLAGI